MPTIELNQQQILAICLLLEEAMELDYLNENNDLELFNQTISGSDITDLRTKLDNIIE
jgi:hypothetical protein